MALRKWLPGALVLCMCLGLCGCAPTLQPENQAFAMSMSVDFAEGSDMLELGILVPTLSNAPDVSNHTGAPTDYERYFAVAASFSAALNALQISMPFTLNLSQLKTVIVSSELAQTDAFRSLIEDMMLTNHLFTTAYLGVSVGPARGILENSRPLVAGRLSVELDTAYEHYGQIGFVPLTRLGDMYYHMVSIYGEPFLMLIATADEQLPRQTMPNALMGASLPGKLPIESSSKNQHLGSAVFREGRMVGVMDGASTRWARVLKGEVKNFSYRADGKALRISLRNTPSIRVDARTDAPIIEISLSVLPIPQRAMPDYVILKTQIRAELEFMLQHCRSLGVDPILFGAKAAHQFLTVNDFRAYRWLDKLKNAQFRVNVDILEAYSLY